MVRYFRCGDELEIRSDLLLELGVSFVSWIDGFVVSRLKMWRELTK